MSLFPRFDPKLNVETSTVAKVANPAKAAELSQAFADGVRDLEQGAARIDDPLSQLSQGSQLDEHRASPLDYDAIPDGPDLPFDREADDAVQQGYAVLVYMSVVGAWAYWVRGEAEREKLRGKTTLPIYTLDELDTLRGMAPEDIRHVHAVKATMGATVLSAHKGEPAREPPAEHRDPLRWHRRRDWDRPLAWRPRH